MANSFFQFKQFTIQQDACAMKVCTDACLFGAWCAAELKTAADAQTLLDVGTGTGILSLMIRQKKRLQIDAIEIDEAAAAQARQNVQDSSWPNAIHVAHGDVLNMRFLKSYDYIISNPPFYENELQSVNAKRNTALHSSQLLLTDLLSFMAKQLKPDGFFFILLPYKRHDEIKGLLKQNELVIYQEISVRQTDNHSPFRLMLKGGFIKQACEASCITIATTNQHYTPAFVELLKDYYLKL